MAIGNGAAGAVLAAMVLALSGTAQANGSSVVRIKLAGTLAPVCTGLADKEPGSGAPSAHPTACNYPGTVRIEDGTGPLPQDGDARLDTLTPTLMLRSARSETGWIAMPGAARFDAGETGILVRTVTPN